MDLASKLWSFCNKLRHDGVDSSDYIEQLTYLLFLKMASEKNVQVPEEYDWQSLRAKEDELLVPHLETTLKELKTQPGILGEIFSDPVSRVRNTKVLKSLIEEIDSIEWTRLDTDVVGLAFEELIGKVANEGKKGAGQYFTPRPLIRSIVNVIKPNPLEKPDFTICDVAVGTAGFLVVAFEWFKSHSKQVNITKSQDERIRNRAYFGQELVQRPRRLALMNMFLHGVNATIKLGDSLEEVTKEQYFDCIITNPPFGNKGANQIPNRDFPVKTSDKQLNFVQHIIERLKPGGRAAIVLPDSCLSSDPAKKIWSYYLTLSESASTACNLHTILILPEGVFAAYANGVKACVLFLQKGVPTQGTWIYNARKNTKKITTKSNVLNESHFLEFERLYGNSPNGESKREENDRFKWVSIREIRENNFDLTTVEVLVKSPSKDPSVILDEMIADYEKKIEALKNLKTKLPS